MFFRSSPSKIVTAVIILTTISIAYAQKKAKTPANPSTTPDEREAQEPIKIFTEEVILPIVAYDQYGHFDPTVGPADVLVIEDGVPQQVTSVRRIQTNTVLLIDMGSQLVFTQHLDTTRQIAASLLAHLHPSDQAILIQFTNRAEVLQNWTEDKTKIISALHPQHGKLLSGDRSLLSEGMIAAADKLEAKPGGSTHIVLITDGDDAPSSEVLYKDAVQRLVQAQPALTVLSYTTLARSEARQRRSVLNFDREMKRFYKNYDRTMIGSEERLKGLAQSLGGRILLPRSTAEALKQGSEIRGDIGAQCVLTYTPKQPIKSASGKLSRHIEVFSRRVGLQVRALRNSYSIRVAVAGT